MSFPQYIPLTSLDGSNGFRLNGIDGFDRTGFSVSGLGDINGDGFDDFIVGAYSADPGGISYAGESYVVFGKAGGFSPNIDLAALDGSNGFRIAGIDGNDFSGFSVSDAGDVNGDGFDDILVGALGGDPGGDSSAGETTVIFGKATPFAASISLATIVFNGVSGFRLEGIDPGDRSGWSVASAGDVNGDGFDDIIIGAPYGDYGATSNTGESYVVFGKAGGFSAALDLASIDGTSGFRLDGIHADDRSGFSVSGAGDVNGDGFADIIIGARYADPGGNNLAGESYVVFGKAGGFAASQSLGLLNGTNGFRITGVADGDQSGRSVASAGDINGDGYDDIVIGAFGADPGGNPAAGSAYVIFGKAIGFTSTLSLASLDGLNGFRIDGVAAGDQAGQAVSAAGDVNGDGFDDLIIGAATSDIVASNAGATYVLFGKAGGYSPAVSLANLNGSNGFIIGGEALDDRSGRSVSAAGDVNGDGFADLLIGAYGVDINSALAVGRSYVVFGRMPTAGVTRIGSDIAQFISGGLGDDILEGRGGDDVLRGQAGDDEIHGDDGADDILGGDGDDTIYGGSGNDTIDGGAGFDIIFAGSGNDTVNAGIGDDQIDTGSGNDTVIGGAGGDKALLREGNDSALGGSGNDDLDGGLGDDLLNGGTGDDVLRGGDGADTLIGSSGSDTMIGGLGNDIYFFDQLTDVMVENANEGIDEVRTVFNHTLADNFENLLLRGGAALSGTGNAANNTITAGVGPATLNGLAGNDTLLGSASGDTLNGGADDDTIFGRFGNDQIDGGDGNDILNGQENSDTISGGIGNDLLRGQDGNDVLNGGDGADNLDGGELIDTLNGDAGNDVLFGRNGNDTLNGGIGNDLIEGGTGRDLMTGGDGADTFRFDDGHFAGVLSTNSDRIFDFSQAQGDKINLSLVDANTGTGADDSFTFIGTAAFTGVAGQLRFTNSGGFTLIEGDTDGNGGADFAIRLDGAVNLVAGDFVL